MAAVPEEEEEVRRLKLEKIRAKLGEALLEKIVKFTSGNINTQIYIHKNMLKNYDNNVLVNMLQNDNVLKMKVRNLHFPCHINGKMIKKNLRKLYVFLLFLVSDRADC